MTTDANTKELEVVTDDNDNTVDVITDQPSASEEKPSPEPEMLTKEQAEKLANERHSKLDKRIAELTKASEKQEKAAQAAEARAERAQKALDEAQKRLDDAERKSYGDSPDGLKLFERQVALRQKIADVEKREAELARNEAEIASEAAEAKQYRVEKLAREIAEKNGVDADLLMALTDGTPEKMEKLAQALPKKTSEPTPKPDSGKAASGFGTLTMEQLEKLPMDKYEEYVQERDKKNRR